MSDRAIREPARWALLVPGRGALPCRSPACPAHPPVRPSRPCGRRFTHLRRTA